MGITDIWASIDLSHPFQHKRQDLITKIQVPSAIGNVLPHLIQPPAVTAEGLRFPLVSCLSAPGLRYPRCLKCHWLCFEPLSHSSVFKIHIFDLICTDFGLGVILSQNTLQGLNYLDLRDLLNQEDFFIRDFSFQQPLVNFCFPMNILIIFLSEN